MGSPTTEEGRDDNEDQVDVTLTPRFWLGQTGVTQGQWEKVMGTTPWEGKRLVPEGANYPAVCVNWDDATSFCVKLTERERKAGKIPSGWSYRLPGEAEWEYACRAGTKSAYIVGEDDRTLYQYAWFVDDIFNVRDNACAVGLKKGNPWGLHDMHGNVWEWCSDWYGHDLTGGRDPQGPSGGSNRVLRGGCWSDFARLCRSACRSRNDPSDWNSNLGFRVALSPSGRK